MEPALEEQEIFLAHQILPTENKIFEAFKYFELKDTKVCLLGLDPYISCEQAMGLSFSVPTGCKIPPSLKNIFKLLYIKTPLIFRSVFLKQTSM